MNETYNAYVPQDRLIAMACGLPLPKQSQGSVLFADISGFTPLTEAYEAHLGSRLGGEELTRVLNSVYAMLIGEVDRMRGSVIGFAGDAITCWFEADNGERALTTALQMQRGMEAFKAIPSPGGGTIALGLKAAITTGTVKRFIVGDETVQTVDVLAGDPVYRVATLENLAGKGEVLVDEGTKRALEGRIEIAEARVDKDEQTTAWVITHLDGIPEVAPWPPADFIEIPTRAVEPWVISDLRERMSSGMVEFITELRPATAIFAKFDGIDFENDPQADIKLDIFFTKVQFLVSRYEGVVHQLTVGDKGSYVYLTFGAPISHEDDTLRAMEVALELLKLVERLDFVSAVKIGIARGTTRTGAYGGPTRRTYGVLGDQVNLAARLMSNAKPGEILVSDSAAREATHAYHLIALPPIRVKGKSEPIRLHRLTGKAESSGKKHRSGHAMPMIGRMEELALAKELIRKSAEGHGQAVTIVADAGLGKSRLVTAINEMAAAQGFQTLYGECQVFGTNTLYTPWWSIWREFFKLKAGADPAQAEPILLQRLMEIDERLADRLPLLGQVLDIAFEDNELTRTFDAKLRRASLEGLLVECLRWASFRQPQLIVLEDVQAIDPVSRDLLRVLIQAAARLPVMLVIAMRPIDGNPLLSPAEEILEYVHVVNLKELSEKESALLIESKFKQLYKSDRPLPGEVVKRITGRTGGNPFFIDEVMNWLHLEKIDATSLEALDRADLPVSLYSLVLSRMDQLSESSRVTMKVASVVGRVFRAAVVWGVYPDLGGEAEVRKTLYGLSENDFIVPSDEEQLAYLFKHVVTHEVAYESLPRKLREQLHEAIGLFMEMNLPAETLPVLELLAFHFGRSIRDDKKKKYFLLAADAARSAYANAAAASYYTSALPLLSELEQIHILQNLGQVYEFSGNWKLAMKQYENGLMLAEKHNKALEVAHFELHIGDLHRKKSSFDEANLWLTKARSAYEGIGNLSGIGQALHSSGTLAAQTGNYDKARSLYTRSMEIRRQLGDDAKVASLLSNIGIIARFQGDLFEALALQEESLAIRRNLNEPWAVGNSLNNLGMAKRYLGELQEARSVLEEGLSILQKVGDRAEIANTLNSLAEVALDQDDAESCENYLKQSLQLARELGNLRSLAFILETFAFNAVKLRHPQRCLRLFGAAKAIRDSIGAPLPEGDANRVGLAINEAGSLLQGVDLNARVREGAMLPLSTALDYAAGVEDSEL